MFFIKTKFLKTFLPMHIFHFSSIGCTSIFFSKKEREVNMDKALSADKKNSILCVVKGVLLAVCLTVVLVLILAVIYKFVDLSDSTIKIINQIIKIVSIGFGVFICLKKDRNKGMLKGSIIGSVYMLVSYIVFSLLVSSFNLSITLLYDIIFGALLGLIFGVIFVNFRK